MLAVRAPAKVNLFLHLAGKRDDGYHLIDTLAVFPEIYDELYFTPSDLLTLQVEGEFADASGTHADNLVLRAARMLNQEAGTNHGAHIRLVKNIPVGAGLGGGSADAAATLKALNAFWELGIDFERLWDLAELLGADVPMCLHSVPLYAAGIGEKISVADQDMHELWIVLAHPNIVLPTKDVFAAISPDHYSWARFDASKKSTHVRDSYNHLYAPAVSVAPVIEDVIDALIYAAIPEGTVSGQVLKVAMTGSGACCYALVADEQTARDCLDRMQKSHPQWWSRMARVTVGI